MKRTILAEGIREGDLVELDPIHSGMRVWAEVARIMDKGHSHVKLYTASGLDMRGPVQIHEAVTVIRPVELDADEVAAIRNQLENGLDIVNSVKTMLPEATAVSMGKCLAAVIDGTDVTDAEVSR
jgi:hypothetical protein